MPSNDFALAQQRIAARRQARDTEARASLAADRRHAQVTEQLNKLPFPLCRLGHVGLTTWDRVRGREGTRPAFRVGQVDAELLDEELLELLKGQVGEALKYFGSHIQDDWGGEILLGLRAVLFKLTIWDHDATYGATLQNLKYTDARNTGPMLTPPSKWQKALYGVLTVGGGYTWKRWEDWLVDNDNGYDEPSSAVKTASQITSALSTVHSTAAFASFLVFLVNGRYRTLVDRILRLRLAPPTSQVRREVSFEYLNRQLVWHAFTEFLLFVLPLVGISRWRRWLARAWRKTKSLVNSDNDGHVDEKRGELAFLPERTCAICYQDQNLTLTSEEQVLAASGASGGVVGSAQTDITNPYETVSCGCIYCFVCLAGRLDAEEGEGWTCLRCGELVRECKPWSGDVLEEPTKTESPGLGVKVIGFEEDIAKEDIEDELTTIEPRSEKEDGDDVAMKDEHERSQPSSEVRE